ncbi:YraN family protein [bacterium]|nr:MAG: YraN family protein [bacterium]
MNQDKTLGAWGENYAARLYIRQGYKLLTRNSFNHTGKQMGEIDLIVLGKNQIIFVEVKTRVSSKYGLPEEAVPAQKQARLLKVVTWFLARHSQYRNLQPRIDVCAILLSSAARALPASSLDKFVKYSKIITNAVELN